jgi:hypothetical protein
VPGERRKPIWLLFETADLRAARALLAELG